MSSIESFKLDVQSSSLNKNVPVRIWTESTGKHFI